MGVVKRVHQKVDTVKVTVTVSVSVTFTVTGTATVTGGGCSTEIKLECRYQILELLHYTV